MFSMALSRSFKFFIALGCALVVGLLWLTYLFFNLSPLAGGTLDDGTAVSTSSVPFVVERGEGFRAVASSLEEAGLIRSASTFKLYSILSGNAHQFKPGFYSFSAASSSIEIIRTLVAGPSKEISVLIPEGKTLAQIDETLASYGVIKRGTLRSLKPSEFVDKYPFLEQAVSLEGFLFPDTYRFFFGSDARDVARSMLDNFVAKINPLVTDEGKTEYESIPVLRRGIFNLNEIITIASMIEDEVPHTTDRPIVADIMYRRLRINMALQIDATTLYANAIKNPAYDTYKQPGLPPGPISSPGIDAITAALNPKSSPYLYYLSDPKTDKTIFSKTFEEHIENQKKYF